MKPRLLIIHNRLVVGGPALDTIPLAYHLQNDFEVHILYGCKEKDETEPTYLLNKYKGLTLVNIKSLQRSLHPIKDFLSYQFIYKYIKHFKPNVVHTHGAKVGLFGRLAAKRAKVPLIIHTFHGHLFHSYFNKFYTRALIYLEKKLLALTDFIIAISESQRRELQQILYVNDGSKIKLVPLGVDYIDVTMKDHYRQAFKRTYDIDNDTICIGILGRMVSIKNPFFFLKVAEDVLNNYKGKKLKFFIVGDGSEIAGMKLYLKQHNIPFSDRDNEHSIVFTSWIQNIQNVLEGMDIVVLTSFNEGTPLSLIEAQLCSKPVVAVNVGGVRDTMIDGETGFLIPKHDVKQFSKAIIQLVDDNELRTQMGEKGKKFAESTFSKQKEISAMKMIYRSKEFI